MIIVKSHEFNSGANNAADLAMYINKNNIKQESIISITAAVALGATISYAIFYYADSESKEITRGFFGWD